MTTAHRRASAQFCRHLGEAMVDQGLSIDAAAQLWGLTRARVTQLLRSDIVAVPPHVKAWVDKHGKDKEGLS
jgi:predicted transcriptional regulator